MALGRIKALLDEKGIRYEMLPHGESYTAQETAQRIHEPGRAFAKATMLEVDEKPVMAVLAAPRRVDLDRLRGITHAHHVALMQEAALKELFPDCDLGAEPPFGNLYGVPVFVDEELVRETEIAFNAGTHHEALRMRLADYLEAVHPTIASFATEKTPPELGAWGG